MLQKRMNLFKKLLCLLILAVLISQPVYAAQTYSSRAEIPEQYKWDLTRIYETNEDWEKDAALLENELIPRIAAYKGRLDGKENILACLKAITEAGIVFNKVYGYAELNLHSDMSNTGAQELYGRTLIIKQSIAKASSYIDPELAKIDEAVLKSHSGSPDFKEYKKLIDNNLKNRAHILSEEEADLLALANMFINSPNEIYSMLNNVDIKFGSVADPSGNEIEVTHGNYYLLLQNPDRDFRKSLSEKFSSAYMDLNNTFASIIGAEVNKNIFLARASNYNSALEASLGVDIPVSVYKNLIDSANKGLAAQHKFIDLRKKVLGLDELQGYDLYVPLIPRQDRYISYEEAKKMVLSALKPLGEEYCRMIATALSEKWVDVYETPNKMGGAYSEGLYAPHPYVLMNYFGTYHCVSTIAHELGHAVHQYYSNNTQAFNDAEVTIFTSEVAAIHNEILLCRYLIENAKTNAEKLLYLNELLRLYSGTFFSQALNAEFEMLIYERVEEGNILNAEALNSIWLNLKRKYYGKSFVVNESRQMGWSMIPHFYYNFYVFQYATSIAAANRLANGIIGNKPGAVDKYLEFLHSGSLYDPITTLANTGADMNSPQVIDELIKEFESLVNELERLLRAEGLIG